MNYITAAKNTKKLSETELKHNISGKASWHYQYKDSAWIYIGGLPYDLTEGDIICVFSQYGEVVNLNLPRDKKTGKSKGFCFLCYEDQKSTILAVDNLNTIKLCGRIVRVDHVEEYKVPKNIDKLDDDALRLLEEGCGPESSVVKTLQSKPRDEQPKREDETFTTELQSPRSLSRSPVRNEEASRRHRQNHSHGHDAAPHSDRAKPNDGFKSTKHREMKEDERADRKVEERTKRRDQEYLSHHDKKRREERSNDYEKEHSRYSDKSRKNERPRHRNHSRSRSRDRDRKNRSRSRSRSRERDRKHRH